MRNFIVWYLYIRMIDVSVQKRFSCITRRDGHNCLIYITRRCVYIFQKRTRFWCVGLETRDTVTDSDDPPRRLVGRSSVMYRCPRARGGVIVFEYEIINDIELDA